MRTTMMTLAAGAILAMTACSQLGSVNPLAPDGLVVKNPLLAGIWMDKDTMYIVKEKDEGYTITMAPYGKGQGAINFSARLMRVGAAEILDVMEVPSDDDSFMLPLHIPVRIWVEQKTLRLAFLDSQWMREQALKELAATHAKDRVILTTPTEAVAKFLLEHGSDERACQGEPLELTRQ